MKVLFDIFPIFLFFMAYKWGDIYWATGVVIIATLAQTLYSRFKTGHFEKLPLITLATVSILGCATLFFRNDVFIKWKPTALYWLLAIIFLASQVWGEKPLIQHAIGQNIALPSKIWHRLNVSWVLFFMLMGAVNIYVLYHFDTDSWVNFKLFGILGATLLFIILQGVYIASHSRASQHNAPSS